MGGSISYPLFIPLTNIDINQIRKEFFDRVYGETTGFACIASQEPVGGIFKQDFFYYPDNLTEMLAHIVAIEHGHNVWFCPHLFDKPQRTKEHVASCNCLWSDLDDCDPLDCHPQPVIAIQSSPARYQGLWLVDTVMPPLVAEDYSRRIAHLNKDHGVDQSGWDLTQLLRVPYSFNYKHRNGADVPQVDLLYAHKTKAPIGLFDELPKVTATDTQSIPFPSELPLEQDVRNQFNRRLSDETLSLLEMPPAPNADWSKLLWKLMLQLYEYGMRREEVYVCCAVAKCNKWARDNKPHTFLWSDVVRAEEYHRFHSNVFADRTALEIPVLATPDEPSTNVGFIKDYVEWASGKTDAASQYHEATAFIVLSSLLAGALRIELEFDTIHPNLWIMIVADTTLTRKTTAMEMGVRLLKSITADKDDVVLATDGSVEGLFHAMQGRSGKPSLFLKDEFTGLMDSIVRKDYMAGMLELLTKLYDGTEQKRVLKKETIHVREPILILYAGGIKTKLFSILREEHVSSGFLPRFIIVSADSDLNKRRPIQRRSEEGEAEWAELQKTLMHLKDVYCSPQYVKLPGTESAAEILPKYRVDFTDDALARLDKIESQLVKAGMESEAPDAYVPMFDRLAKSCMKMAALIAATRQEPVDETIWIELEDVVAAADYIQRWANYTTETLRNVGKTLSERLMDRVMGIVRKHPTGCQRSLIMNTLRLNAEDMQKAIATLEMKGMITTSKKGKALWLFPA